MQTTPFTPFGQTRAQLTQKIDELTAALQQKDRQTALLGRVLIAITQEPRAFQSLVGGFVTVEGSALERVEKGTELLVNPLPDGRLRLSCVRPLLGPPTINGVSRHVG